MDKSILFLMMIGMVLVIVHVPHVVMTLGIISGLSVVSIKLIWMVMQGFSQSSPPSQQRSPVASLTPQRQSI